MSSIRIFNPQELPFGLLSNNFNLKMVVDDEEWENVSQYIYTKLIPEEYKQLRDLMTKIPYEMLPSKYLEYESFIKDDFVKTSLIKGLEQRFLNPDARKQLLDTGMSNLFYINQNNLFFGTTENLIPKLKNMDFTESRNILGQIFEEIRKKLQEEIIESDLVNQYIYLKVLNNTIMESYEKIIELMIILNGKNNDDEKKNYFKKFILELKIDDVKNNIDFDEYKKEVLSDINLLKVLIISKTIPQCLILYSLYKTLRKSCENRKNDISKVVLSNYLDFFSKSNNIKRENIDNELKLVNLNYLEQVILSLFTRNKLPEELNEIINKTLSDVKLLSEEMILEYEKFDVDMFFQFVNDEETLSLLKMTDTTSKKDFLFTDAEPTFSIFTNESIFLENKNYRDVNEYIQKKITENEFFNHEKRMEKIKYLCVKGLNSKFKFDSKNLDRQTLDLHHILYFAKDKNIIHLDEIQMISSITSEYLNYHSKNSININDIITNYEESSYDDDLDSFINNDLFVTTWIKCILQSFVFLISNMFFFIEKKYNSEMMINIDFIQNIFQKIYNHNNNMIETLSGLKMNEIISKYLDLILQPLSDKIDNKGNIKETIWKLFYGDFKFILESIKNESKQSAFKNVIYNIQLDLNNETGQFMVLDDLLDNSILLSIICLLNKINIFSQEYFNLFFFFKNHELDFQLLKIDDPYKFKNLNELRNEILKSENSSIKNKLISFLNGELYSKMEIKNDDLQNVFGIILNFNMYIPKQITKNAYDKEKLISDDQLVDDNYDDYEEEISIQQQNKYESDFLLLPIQNKNKKKIENDDEEEDDDDTEDDEEKEEDDYEDGSQVNDFNYKRNEELVNNFLKKQKIQSNIKSKDVLLLLSEIKKHIKPTNMNIIKSRSNFFQCIEKPTSSIKIKTVKDEKIKFSNDCSNIVKKVVNVIGVKGGSTASETWILEMNDNTKLFCKLFINLDSNEINFDDPQKKINFFLSSKSLDYEKRVYKEIVDPMRRLKVCKHFVPLVDCLDSCSYENLLNILIGHTNDNSNKIMSNSVTDMILKRNINSIINLNKLYSINEISSEPISENKNENIIEKLKYSLLFTKYFDLNSQVITFTKFLEKYYNNRDIILQVLFQLSAVCYAMSLCNMTHNDLHGDNVFVKKLDQLQTFIYYINDVKYEIKTFFKVYIFDFNFTYVEKFGNNEGINDYLCENFSVCNEFIPNKDILKILCAVFNFYPDILKYTTSNDENKKSLEKTYLEDKQCFFRSSVNMGKSVRSDFFKEFNDCLTILKMIYIDIPKNEEITLKISEQKINPIFDGLVNNNNDFISIIHKDNFRNDGSLLVSNQEKYVSDVLLNTPYMTSENPLKEISENKNNPLEEYKKMLENNQNNPIEEYKKRLENNQENPIEENKEIIENQENPIEEYKKRLENNQENPIEEEKDSKINKKTKPGMIKLIEDGYIILKGDGTNILNNFFEEQVEFKNTDEKRKIFSSLSFNCSYPTSFYHPELRIIRKNIYEQISKQFQLYFPSMNIEMLFDCFYNIKKTYSTVECEEFPKDFLKNDIIFRGFINLNKYGDQIFCFKKDNDNEKFKEIIFPGHILLYNVRNIKECDLIANNDIDYRLYFGFRLTKSETSIFKENIQNIENQSTPIIYNGKKPLLYTDEQKQNWGTLVKSFSKKFKTDFLLDERIIPQNISLKEVHEKNSTIPFFPYSTNEMEIHKLRPIR